MSKWWIRALVAIVTTAALGIAAALTLTAAALDSCGFAGGACTPANSNDGAGWLAAAATLGLLSVTSAIGGVVWVGQALRSPAGERERLA